MEPKKFVMHPKPWRLSTLWLMQTSLTKRLRDVSGIRMRPKTGSLSLTTMIFNSLTKLQYSTLIAIWRSLSNQLRRRRNRQSLKLLKQLHLPKKETIVLSLQDQIVSHPLRTTRTMTWWSRWSRSLSRSRPTRWWKAFLFQRSSCLKGLTWNQIKLIAPPNNKHSIHSMNPCIPMRFMNALSAMDVESLQLLEFATSVAFAKTLITVRSVRSPKITLMLSSKSKELGMPLKSWWPLSTTLWAMQRLISISMIHSLSLKISLVLCSFRWSTSIASTPSSIPWTSWSTTSLTLPWTSWSTSPWPSWSTPPWSSWSTPPPRFPWETPWSSWSTSSPTFWRISRLNFYRWIESMWWIWPREVWKKDGILWWKNESLGRKAGLG